ncbi:MAG: hypothetical protein V9E82_03510 [Candidatus Nanopelagicales bacterium]
MTDESQAEAAPDQPTRAEIRRREEFERLCATGYTVCCGGGGRTRKQA